MTWTSYDRYKFLGPSGFKRVLPGSVDLASLHVLFTGSSWAEAELLSEAFLELGFQSPQRLSLSPSLLAILVLFRLARVFVSYMLAKLGAALKTRVTELACVATLHSRRVGLCGGICHPEVAAL